MRKVLLVALGAVALTFGFGQRADAAMFMSLSDGVVTVSCTNPPGACGAAWFTPSANTMVFSGVVGTYTLSSSAEGSNNPGTVGLAQIHNAVTNLNNTGGFDRTLTILVSQNDFTAPAAGSATLGNDGTATFTGGTTSSAGMTYTVQSWVDTTNGLHTVSPLPATATAGPCLLASDGTLPQNSGDCALALTPFTNATPFSLTQRLLIVIPGALGSDPTLDSTGSTTVTQVPIPEPASLLLLGAGLIGLAAKVRGNRNRKS